MTELRFSLGERTFGATVRFDPDYPSIEIREILRVYDGQPERTETALRMFMELDRGELKVRAYPPGADDPVTVNLDVPH